MAEPELAFEALLQHLKGSRGFDFTGYKRSSLMRRVDRRMAQVGIDDYAEYLDHLEVHPDEFTALFNTILINVTGFFRDPDAWEYLRDGGAARAAGRARPPTSPIRVWSAGCASGEEAYTLAMVLAEVLGLERVPRAGEDLRHRRRRGGARPGPAGRLRRARGRRPSRRSCVERYFEPVGGRYVFRKDLRRSVIFGRNDLVQDAPISRIDLLVCRNTLMYFNAETQARILGRFHFALADGGVLFLGKAEMLLSHGRAVRPDRPQAARSSARSSAPIAAATALRRAPAPTQPAAELGRARRSCATRPSPRARWRRSWSPRTAWSR